MGRREKYIGQPNDWQRVSDGKKPNKKVNRRLNRQVVRGLEKHGTIHPTDAPPPPDGVWPPAFNPQGRKPGNPRKRGGGDR